MAKATKDAKRKSLLKSGKPSDDRLIRNCVMYAQFISCIDATFAADPDPNNEISNQTLDTMSDQARQVLAEIAKTPATTRQQLQAKARIAVMAAKDRDDGFDGDQIFEFFTSFAKEVKEFLQPLIEDDWRAAKHAQKTAA